MILYADTSALVKYYIREDDSVAVLEWMRAADVIGMNIITRAEIAAVFARIHRTAVQIRPEGELLSTKFTTDWYQYMRLRVDEKTVERAEAYAWQYGLRGYDAIHLASAVLWQEALGLPVTLATYDRQLWDAARSVGLRVLPEA
jgi:predicted nucleic acid-binding protein